MLKKLFQPFFDGLLTHNPSFVLLLGMCPLLATSTSVANGVGMGLSATAVLICSNIVISILRKLIPNQIRIAAYIVVIAGFVTAVEMIIHAFLPSLYASLGLFIPLITVNCIILARAEAFASKNGVFASAMDGLGMGLGFTGALFIMSTIREVLGNGTFLDFPLFGENFPAATLMVLPVGGFLTLGLVIAAIQKLRADGFSPYTKLKNHIQSKKTQKEAEQ
ncbi:MAG: electron transport complex subunit E [Oscillospiraceae bacterium]|nr:electron transport complex subunit E [Oscillospiraceae bacterium]